LDFLVVFKYCFTYQTQYFKWYLNTKVFKYLTTLLTCKTCAQVSLLARTLPSEFGVDDLLSLHDLSTVSGRRAAARVIVQHARYTASSHVDN